MYSSLHLQEAWLQAGSSEPSFQSLLSVSENLAKLWIEPELSGYEYDPRLTAERESP